MTLPIDISAQTPPWYATFPNACRVLGIGRTKLYALAGEGRIRIVKVGHRSLVDINQALGWMATLPAAEISPQTRKPPVA